MFESANFDELERSVRRTIKRFEKLPDEAMAQHINMELSMPYWLVTEGNRFDCASRLHALFVEAEQALVENKDDMEAIDKLIAIARRRREWLEYLMTGELK